MLWFLCSTAVRTATTAASKLVSLALAGLAATSCSASLSCSGAFMGSLQEMIPAFVTTQWKLISHDNPRLCSQQLWQKGSASLTFSIGAPVVQLQRWSSGIWRQLSLQTWSLKLSPSQVLHTPHLTAVANTTQRTTNLNCYVNFLWCKLCETPPHCCRTTLPAFAAALDLVLTQPKTDWKGFVSDTDNMDEGDFRTEILATQLPQKVTSEKCAHISNIVFLKRSVSRKGKAISEVQNKTKKKLQTQELVLGIEQTQCREDEMRRAARHQISSDQYKPDHYLLMA